MLPARQANRLGPVRVSQVTSGPLSPPKPREVHSAQRRSSQQARERERERGRGPEEGSYEAGLSGLMDEHLEHLAQLIARKRALEERKSPRRALTRLVPRFTQLTPQRRPPSAATAFSRGHLHRPGGSLA